MDLAPGTVRNRISIVRTFFEWCIDRGYARTNPLAGMRSPKEPRRLPRGLSPDEVSAVLRECPDERTTLIVLLECQEMLRAKEVAGLQFGDIDRAGHELRVVGKGGHERVIPASDETWEALNRYLTAWPARSGPLIRSKLSPHQGVQARYIVQLVADVMRAAGVGETGHALRHTGATDMLRNGADIVEVRDALGHASIATTQRYLGVTRASELRKAMGGRRYGGVALTGRNMSVGVDGEPPTV
jgi:integrase/recombinase XerD